MRIKRRYPGLVLVTGAVAAFWLGGCGGGSGGGGAGAGAGSPVLLEIRAGGVGVALWVNVGGVGSTPPQCPGTVFLNSVITFIFGGRVDPSTLPATGTALGTINITTSDGTSTVPAFGGFTVEDDPALPPGNQRVVRFSPTAPTDPMQPAATAGMAGNVTYTIFVPRTGSTGQVLSVGGAPLTTEATTCFATCDPLTNPLGAAGCFTDPIPGPPFVVATTPSTNDPAPPSIDPANVTNNTVTIIISEPLFPENINLQNVRLINSASTAQVPGSVQFYQAGTPEAGPSTARIDYIASSQLLANVVYEIEISSDVKDFGQNSVVLYDPTNPLAPPSGDRFFSTIPVPFCPQPPIVEDFSSTVNRGPVTGVAVWNGSGQLTSTFPFELVGDGSFGTLTFSMGASTLDTGMPPVTGFSQGKWDTTGITVPSGATVRAIGNYRVHLRSLGQVNITGTIQGSAGMTSPTLVPPGSPDQGPGAGAFDNGGASGTMAIVLGGVGGVGGGKGGRASQSGYTVRTLRGESGFGPTVDGMPNPGPYGANPLYGGGQGGQGGFRYPGPGSVMGELGGIGAAGGSGWQGGQNGQPRTQAPACMPVTPTVQTISMATPPPPTMVFPISTASAGSGGGGGGDRHETINNPNMDDQGGGGGGGGGGIRISSIGDLNINGGAVILMEGAAGAMGNIFFGGGGGGGSGGEIWLQSFSQLNISSAAQMKVTAGAAGTMCGTTGYDHASGAGGYGCYQLEDSDGMINTNFLPVGGGQNFQNINVVTFPFSTIITGVATSVFFDTGYGDPDYDPNTVVENFDLGGANAAPNATVLIEYQGAFETLTGGQPDLGSLSPWVTSPNLDMIDGYRYVRFRVTISYDAPNAQGTGSNPNNTLPVVNLISFGYSAPLNCP